MIFSEPGQACPPRMLHFTRSKCWGKALSTLPALPTFPHPMVRFLRPDQLHNKKILRLKNMPNLPPQQTGPAAWYGPDMTAQKNEWLSTWTPAEIGELEAAADAFIAGDKGIGQMTPADFPLPTWVQEWLCCDKS